MTARKSPVPESAGRTAIRVVGVGVAVFALAWLSLSITQSGGRAAAIWPANAVILAALTRSPARRWLALRTFDSDPLMHKAMERRHPLAHELLGLTVPMRSWSRAMTGMRFRRRSTFSPFPACASRSARA